MDEVIRIYRPKPDLQNTLKSYLSYCSDPADFENPQPKNRSKFRKPQTRWETLCEVLEEKEKQIRDIRFRHPGFDLIYNWVVAVLIVVLLVSCVYAWGHARKINKEEAIYATAYADFTAAQTAKEEAEEVERQAALQSIEAKKKHDIDLMEHCLAGIQLFIENRGYTDIDLETYGQCPINRVLDNTEFAWCTTLEDAIMQEGQWVGFSMSNQPTMKHQQIAEKLVNRYYNNEPQPCSSNYCWTEFTDKGVWLKNECGPATFNNTWRAG